MASPFPTPPDDVQQALALLDLVASGDEAVIAELGDHRLARTARPAARTLAARAARPRSSCLTHRLAGHPRGQRRGGAPSPGPPRLRPTTGTPPTRTPDRGRWPSIPRSLRSPRLPKAWQRLARPSLSICAPRAGMGRRSTSHGEPHGARDRRGHRPTLGARGEEHEQGLGVRREHALMGQPDPGSHHHAALRGRSDQPCFFRTAFAGVPVASQRHPQPFRATGSARRPSWPESGRPRPYPCFLRQQ